MLRVQRYIRPPLSTLPDVNKRKSRAKSDGGRSQHGLHVFRQPGGICVRRGEDSEYDGLLRKCGVDLGGCGLKRELGRVLQELGEVTGFRKMVYI